MTSLVLIQGGLDSAESILVEAERLINGPKRDDYGSVRDSFQTHARMWSPILGKNVSPTQVALCMSQLKLGRMIDGTIQRDSLVDAAGYIGLAAQILGIDP